MIASYRAARVVERNTLAYRRMWYIFAAGFAEPVLYLLSIGVGVGRLVGTLPGHDGDATSYQAFVAPGMMAAAAMNGSALDSTFNFFVKYKYLGTYDTMLATPLGVADLAVGEVAWALLRGSLYATAFLVTMIVMGLTASAWAVLAVPASLLIGFAFAGAGLATTTWMRSFVDFDYVNLALVVMFLFSGTFFPLSRYPTAVQLLVRCTPLYQGVALERSLVLGDLNWALVPHATALLLLGWLGISVASRRLGRLLQP